MPDTALILAFNLTLIAAWLAPGPAMLVALQSTVAGGLRAGIATGIGLAFMASLWTLAALFGLDALFRVAPWAFGAIKLAGAVYLIWIAVQTWRHARQPLTRAPDAAGRALRRGLLVNLGNPKSILFAAAVLVVIFPPDMGTGARLVIALNHLVVEIVAYSALALLVVTSRADRLLLSFKTLFDRLTATVLGMLGLRLLLDRT